MSRCLQPKCNTCPFVSQQKSIKSSASDCNVIINQSVNCDTKNIVYCISCTKKSCNFVQYIGETGRKFKDRMGEHLNYVKKPDLSQPTGAHFNMKGHSISDMKMCIIEKCSQNSTMYRKTREEYFITKFNSKHKGLNKKM